MEKETYPGSVRSERIPESGRASEQASKRASVQLEKRERLQPSGDMTCLTVLVKLRKRHFTEASDPPVVSQTGTRRRHYFPVATECLTVARWRSVRFGYIVGEDLKLFAGCGDGGPMLFIRFVDTEPRAA